MLPACTIAAVIDNGFGSPGGQLRQPVRRLDFAGGAPDPQVLDREFPEDEGTHGWRAAAMMSALAGASTEMLLCRVAAGGSATDFDRDAANAVCSVARERAAVIYFGWASYEPMPLLARAMEAARDTTLFVAPAGNSTGDLDRNPVFPAAFEHENLLTVTHERLLQVGARDDDVGHGSVSVDTVLVGLDLHHRRHAGAFALGDTSGAAAAAAGMALSLAIRHPEWSPIRLKGQLLSGVGRPPDPILAAQLKSWTVTGGFLHLPG